MSTINQSPVKANLPQTALVSLILAAALTGLLAVTAVGKTLNEKTAEAKEAARPAKISLIKLTAPDCQECFNIQNAVTALKALSVEITDERELPYGSDEAKTLINDLKITRLPTLVVKGETENPKFSQFAASNGVLINNVFVLNKIEPPFIEPTSGQTIGLLKATLVSSPTECSSCIDAPLFLQRLKTAGVKITEEKTLDFGEAEKQDLIKQYRLTTLPALLLSSEAREYSLLASSKFGTFEDDGTFVYRSVNPPYYDIEKKKLAGLVTVTYISDSSCSNCYDVKEHKKILEQGYGVSVASERTVDINSAAGQALQKKYSFNLAPTVLISPEASLYSALKAVWPTVGTIAPDGWYVFQRGDKMGQIVYRNLQTGQIVGSNVAAASASSSDHHQ